MGYISKKIIKRLELTGRWYPTRTLFKHSLTLMSMSLGYVLLMLMIFDWDLYGLWGSGGVGTKVLYYIMMGMMALIMYTTGILAVKNERLRRDTCGMLIKEFKGSSINGMATEIRNALDEADHPYTETEWTVDKGFLLRDAPLIHHRFDVRNGDLKVLVSVNLVTYQPLVIIGPPERLDDGRYDGLWEALCVHIDDEDIVVEEVPIIKGGPYQEFCPSSTLR